MGAALSEEIVYRHAIEGLFLRSVGMRLTPELKDRLRAIGLDLDEKIPHHTPRHVFAEALGITARYLYPDVDAKEGYRRLGMGVIKGLEHTLLGKALVSLWPIFGPDRVLSRMQESFATVNNYLKTELITHGRADHTIKVSECNGNPGYHMGIIEAGLTRAGAKNIRVEPFDFNGHACSYRVRWDS
ncbi:DUF2378 family protein [Corallococcus exiguus]|nr:DUF2378 family protein [Corallococcus exiguus]NRD43308.1 DUF2378 family protein [Corallococcus exiguus]